MKRILLIICIAMLFSSCANKTKIIKKCSVIQGIKICETQVTISSWRKYPKGMWFKYDSEEGFEFHADQIENIESPIEKIGMKVLNELLKKVEIK